MKLRRALALALPLAVVAVACDKKEPPTTTAPSASAVASTVAPASASAAPVDSADGHHDRAMHRGPTAMLIASARAQDLKDAQKTKIDEIEKKLAADAQPKSNEGKELHADLVAGIKAGKIDDAKMQAHYAAMEKTVQAQHDAEAAAITALHDALEPAQRKAVVADVKTKMTAMADRMKAHADKDMTPAERAKKRVERMTKQLDLDADQQKKIEAIYVKNAPKTDARAEHMKQVDALLAAFEKDTFDAKKLDAMNGAGKAMRPMLEQHVKTWSEIVPILKPEQRDKLADRMGKSGMEKGWGPSRRPPMLEIDEDESPAQ